MSEGELQLATGNRSELDSAERWGQGPGKHGEDLRALSPTEEELIAAARWSRSQDPSEGYEQMLREVLAHLGVEHVDL